jgi:hypothetical protein
MAQIYLMSKEESKDRVLEWIQRTFCRCPGLELPRKEAHESYLKWCAEHKIEPTTQPVFGKLLCEVFGEIKSRRLGSRQSSVMYYSDFYYTPEALAEREEANHSGQPSLPPLASSTTAHRNW